MKSGLRIFFLVLLFFGIYQFSLGQDSLKQKAQKENFKVKSKALGLKKNPDYYYKHKVNISKKTQLEAAGVDFQKMDNTMDYQDYKASVLIADIVLVGTIIEREYDSKEDVLWHTTLTVQVEEVLKGEKVKKIIKIKLMSGASGNGFVEYSHEQWALNVGEKYVFYLENIDWEKLEDYKANKGFKYNANASKEDDNCFTVYKVLNQKSGYLYDGSIRLEAEDIVKRQLINIEKINDTNNFYKINFNN